MNDIFHIELRKANVGINKILAGNDVNEIFSTIETIEDGIDVIQTVSTAMDQSTFLDALILLDDYAEKPWIDAISDIIDVYISHVERGKIMTGEMIDDDKLMGLFMAKCLASDDGPITQFMRLLTAVACVSLKNGETLQKRHDRLMTMLPNDIAADYEKSRRITNEELPDA